MIMDAQSLWTSLQQLLGPIAEPVAVTFSQTRPAGVERIATAAPAGCMYWRLAAEGATFYTEAADHLNCPIGAYTHGAELPSEAQGQLQEMVETMVGLQYLRMAEVPGIPRRREPLRIVTYLPLSKAKNLPDVVLLRGNARQMMLVVEAAGALELMTSASVMGRPACAVIAATIESGKAATSLGCIGNRVYTQLPDSEFYVAIPGAALPETLDSLRTIANANAQLEHFHRGRLPVAS
jgi:uncharacterized protein (DUF169 family)